MNTLKQTADHILCKLGLAGILEKYGEIHPVGSYAIDAMVWNDLDIDVVNDSMTLEKLHKLTSEILERFKHVWYEAKREVNNNGKTVYFHGFEFYINGELWNTDIWFFDRETVQSAEDFCLSVKHSLEADPKKKDAVRRIKLGLIGRGLYNYNPYTSMDVYRAVIDDGVTDIEEFLGNHQIIPV